MSNKSTSGKALNTASTVTANAVLPYEVGFNKVQVNQKLRSEYGLEVSLIPGSSGVRYDNGGCIGLFAGGTNVGLVNSAANDLVYNAPNAGGRHLFGIGGGTSTAQVDSQGVKAINVTSNTHTVNGASTVQSLTASGAVSAGSMTVATEKIGRLKSFTQTFDAAGASTTGPWPSAAPGKTLGTVTLTGGTQLISVSMTGGIVSSSNALHGARLYVNGTWTGVESRLTILGAQSGWPVVFPTMYAKTNLPAGTCTISVGCTAPGFNDSYAYFSVLEIP